MRPDRSTNLDPLARAGLLHERGTGDLVSNFIMLGRICAGCGDPNHAMRDALLLDGIERRN